MADGLTARIKNEHQFLAAFKRKSSKLSDMSDPIARALSYIEDSIIRNTIQKQVETEDVGQVRFRALDPKYAKWKRKFGTLPILTLTTSMLNPKWFLKKVLKLRGVLRYVAVGRPSGPGGRKGKTPIKKYARYHQAGRGVPRRKWFGLRKGDREQVTEIVGHGVKIAVRA